MKNRDRFEILSLILQVANGGGNNATVTRIMKRALLGYKQMKEHLAFLTERDLLYYDTDIGTFKTTETGMRFLQIYSRIEDMIKPSSQQQQQYRERGGRRQQRQAQAWISREKYSYAEETEKCLLPSQESHLR
jgi:predicted transcriptional regulator